MGEPLQPDEHGVNYEPSEKPESELYRDLLPLLNSCAVDLLEHDKLATQLISLERRTSRGGKDNIDHAPGAHDDVANAVAGALVTAFSGSSYSAAQRAKDNETIATAYKRYARAWP
jgi:hypothetical protein